MGISPETVISALAALVSFLALILMGVFGYLLNREIQRIDRLESGKADKEHVDQRFEELKAGLKEHREEGRESFKEVFQKLDRLAERSP